MKRKEMVCGDCETMPDRLTLHCSGFRVIAFKVETLTLEWRLARLQTLT
jgi:hypothetical protein